MSTCVYTEHWRDTEQNRNERRKDVFLSHRIPVFITAGYREGQLMSVHAGTE